MAITVNDWLKGDRDYFTGIQILQDHQVSAFLIKILSDGPDDYNTPKLLEEIEKLKPVALPVKPEARPELARQGQAPIYVPDPSMEKKLRIDARIKQIWKEMCHLHGQLDVLPPGQALHEVTRELMLKKLKRQDLWDHLHYFETNGVWFDDLPENQAKPMDPEQEIKNLMANRSKAAANLKKPLPAAKKTFYENKIAAINVQIDNLKKLRNG